MGDSPFRLYRRAASAVICLMVIFSAAQTVYAQFAQRSPVSKGPRAVGLLELTPNGAAHLIPICIMVDGHFYDASAYKAVPVPMALDPGTVYEAERTGTSLGLFTVKVALRRPGVWIGQGSLEPVARKNPERTLKVEEKPREEEEDKPPVLRHPGSEPSKTQSKPAETKPAPAPAGTPTKAENSNPAPASAANANISPSENDPNRPRLRRGGRSEDMPSQAAKQTPNNSSATIATKPALSSPTSQEVQLIPAISDADGPDPRPYTFDMKPEEEQAFRRKILALASQELLERTKQIKPGFVAPHAGARTTGSELAAKFKPPQPAFDEVNLRAFDVATNNEPILVLTAKAQPAGRPAKRVGEEASSPDFYVAVVAHSDLYGELRPLLSVITDDQHLDVTPRLELVDVVDADGDGRGELLFRKISHAGRAYAIYRVGADRLWPLYEGTASSE